MATLKFASIVLISSFLYTVGFSRPKYSNVDSLKGYTHINVDVTALKDTAGVLEIRIGGATAPAKIEDGKLVVNYYLEMPRRSYLLFYPRDTIKKYPSKSLNDIAARFEDYFEFLAHPGTTSIAVKGNLNNSRFVNASQAQVDFDSLAKKTMQFEMNFGQLNQDLYQQLQQASGQSSRDSLRALLDHRGDMAYQKYCNEVIFKYIKNNPDSPTALWQLYDYSIMTSNPDMDAVANLYSNLSSRIKAQPIAKTVYNKMDSRNFAISNLLGKAAPDFTVKNASGKNIALHDFKGRVTLLEFWASWCGACRAANPALVKTYQKYKSKNFKIIGISLDFEKNNWLKAIADDQLPWTHVSELKGMKGDTSKQYHIFVVPSNFLINTDGKVLAKDLNDKQLNDYLARLYKSR